MPAVWFALKRSLDCKSNHRSDAHEPRLRSLNSIITRRPRCGCSKSISHLRDVVHGSKRHAQKPPSCSPRSIASSEFINPITHEVVFNNSKCEIKIMGVGGKVGGNHSRSDSNSSTFVGTLHPGTPGPRGQYMVPSSYSSPRSMSTPSRRIGSSSSTSVSCRSGGFPKSRSIVGPDAHVGSLVLTCHKCGERFKKLDAVEAHHLSKHAVTELSDGDSSKKIVEIICQTSWLKSEYSSCGQIERVLKVHNMQKTLARFEEYREMVKIRASKLSKKHSRCLADGNELLRFHSTIVACSLGVGSSALCNLNNCGVCRILRHGFPSKKELAGGAGIFTSSTSARAIESIKLGEGDECLRKALLVCRVIAGRVHKPLENIHEMASQSGFDSLAGKVGQFSSIEELYIWNPKALLPCFVVICKP
ncbi:uncharacterized protein LOC115677962 isoform X1 [Syzygium oleosum]|uniref:uncharacterized protein LOC115677962 isoform X1 n=1 Tax=Syzygium oleosum TaxID=219896 RepID=UPI0024B9DE01|nr:uncharacterized protein LOC115677962 isoform X1 [Syzygium oleosum]